MSTSTPPTPSSPSHRPPQSLPGWGVASDVRHINVLSYLLSSFVSVSSLVFLSASTSFVLTAVVRVPLDHLGRINGSLVLLDEIVALPTVLFWGRIADVYGYRAVTVIGHLLVAAAFSIFVQSNKQYQLYLSRVLISVGLSALTTMLSAILASMTGARSSSQIPAECPASIENEHPQAVDEQTTLLQQGRRDIRRVSQGSARLSGLIGFISGLGALFAVFILLQLPPKLANLYSGTPRDALKMGVKASFYVASLISGLVGILMIFGLARKGESYWPVLLQSRAANSDWKDSFKAFTVGFKLSRHHRHLAVAYAAGFSARATTIAVSAYVPVFVNQYYMSTGKCQLDRPDAPSEEVKKGCHAAFALASAITGTVQLSALLLAPAVGWIASFYSQSAILAMSNALGALGFFIIGSLPTPNHFLIWPTAIALGLAQISGVVVSLSLCASCRWQIHYDASDNNRRPISRCPLPSGQFQDANRSLKSPREISGAIAGVYSLCGGLGILVGSFGGILADWAPQAPFYLTGLLTTIVSFVCCSIVLNDRS